MAVKLRTFVFGFALTVSLATGSLAWAADQTVILRLGAESALLLERPFKTVLIGDPNVVDVLTRGDRSIVLKPLNRGVTNIILLDERSIVTTNIRILVYEADASHIMQLEDPTDCEHVDVINPST
jgi:Flp pilus assembly secretin CpaC